ncbi:uncharacterized protein FYW61_009614 [Anableps anableps]
MASEREELAPESRWRFLSTWFDIEIAAVVTILLGFFQLLLSISIIQSDHMLPKIFMLPFVLGIVIVTGGSFTIACQKNPSELLLRGCACSNVLGLLGSLVGFGIYSYILNTANNVEPCLPVRYHWEICPQEMLAAYSWSLALQLLLYDTVTVVMHLLLSLCAFKSLKTK